MITLGWTVTVTDLDGKNIFGNTCNTVGLIRFIIHIFCTTNQNAASSIASQGRNLAKA